jgi:Polyketide cyclase / dehydrase and lipid transport
VPRFEKKLEVSAPAERAWEVIGDLALMGGLAGATEVEVEGMKRVCTFPNGAVQHERISDYSPDRRSYSYAIEDGPLPVRNNHGGFAVERAGAGSAIVWEAEFEPIDSSQEQAMSEMWEGAMDHVLAAIEERIEIAG